MRPLSRILGYRAALVAALLVSACQHDSNADFDDTQLPSSNGATAAGGASPEPGASGAADEGGSSAQAGGGRGGGGGGGGKPSAGGMAGNGSGGKASMGGKAGQAGASGSGGAAQSGSAGTGGMPGPDPITVEITDFEDTTIDSCEPNQSFSNLQELQTDGDFCRFEALLRPVLQDLPAGAQVSDATLSLYCVNPGGQVNVSYITDNWKDSTVHFNTRPRRSEPFAHFTCAQPGDVIDVDVTEAVTAWLGGARAAYGIYLTTEATDGTDFSSSEASKTSERPLLRVTYLP